MDKKEGKMGQIINTRNLPDKTVVCRILLNQEEIANLKGHMKNIHVFSENLCNQFSQINTRGNAGVTKYFKIPLGIRSRKKHNGNLSYQMMETPTKAFYIYTLGKEKKDNDEKKIEEKLPEKNLEQEF